MTDHDHPGLRFGVSDVFERSFTHLHDLILGRRTVRILVVVDGGISLTEGPSAFGLGRVIRLLRESEVGCTSFEVDTARREDSGAGSPTYREFRFTDTDADGELVINGYHEIWCFGFNPDNFALGDDRIELPSKLPLSDPELRVLTEWMNVRKGGLLAMGDHDYLGASMCYRIPRIRSMRRWTNAQGVPPIGGASDPDTHLRHDTNQPRTPGQHAGTAQIPFLNQEDSVPQEIDWTPWMTHRDPLRYSRRPHPVLCHPEHGPIDVMPDHPHEGWLYEDDEIDLAATYDFDGLSGHEYPTLGGVQPQPMVIAHGWTTPDPPYDLAKGPSPHKRFGMVSVYDGHPVNVGRVATDSTWHHWFDENIQAIEAAGGANWDKISRYYLNVASWLAPPGQRGWCLVVAVMASHLGHLGFQEYGPNRSVFDLGRPLHVWLGRHLGPCWVSEWIFDRLRLVDDDIWKFWWERIFDGRGPRPGGDPCLSCPPFELFEIAVLGGVVRATSDLAEEIRGVALAGKRLDGLDLDDLDERFARGVELGVAEFAGAMQQSLDEIGPLLRRSGK